MSESHNQSSEEYEEESIQESVSELHSVEEEYNATAVDPSESTPAHHIRKAEEALDSLKKIVKAGGWKRILKQKSGVAVYSKPGGYENNKLPIFMGQHQMEGFPPQAVFSVIGMRKLWDELYEEGNLVENLDETTSLTYMVMQGMAGSKTRDFSLVEKVDCSQEGTIFFVSTSVDTPKIPPCVGRVRANVKLNGWILKPTSENPPVTKVTYVLQSDVRGWIPSVFAKKYLSRRPLVLHTIKSYLEKNGPPPVILVTPQSSRRTSLAAESLINNKIDKEGVDTMETKVIRQKILFRNDTYSSKVSDSYSYEDETYSPKVPSAHENETYSSKVSDEDETYSPKVPSAYENEMYSPKVPSAYENETYSPKVSSAYENEMYSSNLSSAYEDETYSPKVSSVHATREARVAPEYTLDIMDLSGNEGTTDFSFHKSLTASINDEDVSSENLPEEPSESSEESEEEEVVMIPEPKKQMIVHRHTESVRNAMKNLKSLYNDNNWVLYTENKNAKVYTKDGSKSTPIMRGDATYIGHTPDDILAVVASLDFKKLWDDRFDEGSTYERWSLDDTLTRAAVKGTFPVSGRDMSLINTVERDPETGTIWFVNTSVVDPAIPVTRKYVRAELSTAGWILKPKKNESGSIKAVDITYIVDIDIKLDSLPTAILKSISVQTPMCVAKVDEVMQKYGFPPYVKRLTGELKHDEFNVKTSQHDFTFKVDGGGIVDVQTSMKMYPSGFDISVKPENVNVELAHDERGLVRLTMPTGTDSREIKVTIVKNTQKGVKVTHNRTRNIPVFSLEAEVIKPTVSPTQKVKKNKVKKTKRKAVNPERPAKSEPSDSRISKEPVIMDIGAGIDRGVIPTDVPPRSNRRPKSSIFLIKKPIEEPAIKAIDTESNESVIPADAPPVNKRSSRRRMSFLVSPNRTVIPGDTHRLSTTLHNKSKDEIPALKTSKRKTIEHNSVIVGRHETGTFKDETLASITSKSITIGEIISRHTINISVTDLVKNIRLGSQQVGLMMASMILAYYAGKISDCNAP